MRWRDASDSRDAGPGVAVPQFRSVSLIARLGRVNSVFWPFIYPFLPFPAVQVDLKTHTVVADGSDFYKINPKGAVPALEVDGKMLTENSAILQYVADLDASNKLGAGAWGSWNRYKMTESLGWVASELHKTFGPLFNPATPDEWKTAMKERLAKHFTTLDTTFAKQKFLVEGTDAPTVADLYCYVCLSWCGFVGVDLSPYTNVHRFQKDVEAVDAIAKGKAEWLSGGKK